MPASPERLYQEMLRSRLETGSSLSFIEELIESYTYRKLGRMIKDPSFGHFSVLLALLSAEMILQSVHRGVENWNAKLEAEYRPALQLSSA